VDRKRAAVTGLAALALLAVLVAVRVVPRWLTPIPTLELILSRAAAHDFEGANQLVPAFLQERKGEGVIALFLWLPPDSRPESSPREVVALAPRGRVFDARLGFRFDDRRGAAAEDRFVRLETEGREIRSFGPISPSASSLGLTPEGETLGPEGAAGRWTLVEGARSLERAPFEILGPSDRAPIVAKLASADTLAGGDRAVIGYLRLMVFLGERCYADALAELEALEALSAGDAALACARARCLRGLRL
jgi:hypothetical protein